MKQHLYQQIIQDIKQQIGEKNFTYHTPICTEKSLCEKYGVSRITAIRALDELEKGGIISRKRGVGCFVVDTSINANPLKFIDEITPDRRVVALVMPFQVPASGLFATVQRINNTLASHNINICLLTTEHNEKLELETLRKLHSEHISALIYYPDHVIPYAELYYFIGNKIPVVILDLPSSSNSFYNVYSDNTAGQYQLTQHLIDAGHRKIAYFSAAAVSASSIRDRLMGYVTCLADNDIPFEEDMLISEFGLNKENLKELVQKLHAQGVTAIECAYDQIAFSLYLTCQSLDLKVPEQMALTGFDDSHWATLMGFSLTTARQDFAQMGEIVSEIVLSELQGTPLAQKRYVLPTTLVPRKSSEYHPPLPAANPD